MTIARHDRPGAESTARLVSGVGLSGLPEARECGAAAAADAVRELPAAPALVIVYAGRERSGPDVLAGVRSVVGDAELVGATTDEFFVDGDVHVAEDVVSVLAMTAGPYRIGVASILTADVAVPDAAREVTRAARANAGERLGEAAILLFGDGNNHHHQQVLAGIHAVAGSSVPIAGGGFGDRHWIGRTELFHNDRVIESGIVVVWIESPYPLTVAVEHGWLPAGLPQLITAADGIYVDEIEGVPAVELVRRQFPDLAGAPGSDADPSAALPWSLGLGLIEPEGTQFIRGFVIEDGNRLRMNTALPPFAAVQFVRASPSTLLGVDEQVIGAAVAGRAVGVVIVFSCVGRLRVLGERAPEEAAEVHAAAGGAHTFGVFSYGEFARVSGITGHHNSTVVAVAL